MDCTAATTRSINALSGPTALDSDETCVNARDAAVVDWATSSPAADSDGACCSAPANCRAPVRAVDVEQVAARQLCRYVRIEHSQAVIIRRRVLGGSSLEEAHARQQVERLFEETIAVGHEQNTLRRRLRPERPGCVIGLQ